MHDQMFMNDEQRQQHIENQRKMQEDMDSFTNQIKGAFAEATDKASERLVIALEQQFINKATYAPGAAEGTAEFRAGQNDVVFMLRHVLDSMRKGESK